MTTPDRLAQLKQVYLTIEKLQSKLDALQLAQTEPIAIIGQSCRYPHGANSPEAYWQLLLTGRDGITDVPPARWNAAAYYDPQPDRPGKIATRWGGFLDNVSDFDARFFGVAPREAAQMDPQQRLLLEVAWEALEAAGQPAAALAGTPTGVYIGLLNSEYGWLQMRDLGGLDAYSGTGTSTSVASGRLSYVLGLQGPSVTLDTACSSSLVAIHLACQALRQGECRLALAGGVSLILSPLALMPFSRMGLLAADGRCKTLDASADGFGSGEGCGLVVLKRLSDAQADGDPILALIRGSAVNQDGRTNVLAAPNGRSQEAVIRRALENAQLTPRDLALIELHGTGTALGDPIETDALRAIFLNMAEAELPPVYLGAVKSNVGHTGAAAGIASVIKAVLALRHDTVPPNLHFAALNPHVNLAHTPFVIPTAPRPLPRGAAPRYVGVSAFGWSGTNAHLILSDPPAPVERPAPPVDLTPGTAAQLLTLSGRSEAAVRDLAAATRDHLRANPALNLADAAYTAAVRRSHHAYRLAVLGAAPAEAADRLAAHLAGANPPGVAVGRYHGARRRKLVFVFSPHGAQWLGMARALYAEVPAFRAAFEAGAAALRPHVAWNLNDLLHAADGAWLEEIDRLQPFLFAYQVALTAAWHAWGVEPDAVVGHSMGEVAAAHVAGVLSLDDAAQIIARRTQLLRGIRGAGAMGVVELSYTAAQEAIAPFGGRLSVAANNSPRSTVLAGEPEALEVLFDQLQARGVFCGWGVADVASHSPHMAALNAELRQALGVIQRAPARLPLYSTVTGALDDGRQFDTEYWVRHLNQPVLFAEAVQRLAESGHDLFLELSPGPVLGPDIEEGLRQAGVEGLALAALRRQADGRAALLESLGQLYAAGYAVNWGRVHPAGAVVPLPAYPWQRERFWLAASTDELVGGAVAGRRASAANALLGEQRAVADAPNRVLWENTYEPRYFPPLFQHHLFGRAVLPASACVALALAASDAPAVVTGLKFERALLLAEAPPWTAAQVLLAAAADGGRAFSFYSRAEGGWTRHATGRLAPAAPEAQVVLPIVPEALRLTLSEHASGPDFYPRFEALGVTYGPELQGVAEVWWSQRAALARLQLPDRAARDLTAEGLPAAAIDPALQAFAWLVAQAAAANGALYAPTRIEQARWLRPGAVPAWASVMLDEAQGAGLTGTAALFAADGTAILELAGLCFSEVAAGPASAAEPFYEVLWEPADLPPTPAAPVGRWLLFADERGVGAALAAALAPAGAESVVVRAGDTPLFGAGGQWVLRPNEPGDYAALWRAHPPATFHGALHLWSLDAVPADLDDDAAAALTRCLPPVLHLAQSLKRAAPEAALPLWLVTAGAQPVMGAPAVPEQAALWGLGYVLAEEHHELWGGLLDTDPAAAPAATAALLCRHLAANDAGDRVAFRGDQRYAARLARLTLPAPDPRPLFRADAAYLLTGGFGGLALTVARWAVAQGARRLVLLGRGDLPPRRAWRALDPASPEGRRAQAVQELEALGAAVHWGAVDVGDGAALAAWLDAYAAEGWPAIRGVLHCAAVIDDKLLVDLDAESVRRVARPKAAGAWHLHRYFQSQPLDCFVLFSSSGSLMGAAGQGNYAAANAALDALAHLRRAAGLPALSINWGFWRDLGFAATPGGRRSIAYMDALGLLPFAPADALAALGALLARPGLTQAAAMLVDWRRWQTRSRLVGLPAFVSRLAAAEAGPTAPAAPAPSVRDQLLALDPGPLRRHHLQTYLRGQLAEVLRLDPATIEVDSSLGSLGIDSLTAIELRNRLERGLGVPLSATLVWNYPTIAALAPFLAEKMGLALTPPAALAAAPAPDADLTAFLAQAERLSEAELRQLLNEGQPGHD
ncbi:MAG: type I polyketide synthase [Anaerolineales bacterium]|nr:type I polyketide synthase [Anaerolineales bacterium]